jgi:hypothetical protein
MKTYHLVLFLMSMLVLGGTSFAQAQRDSLTRAQHRRTFADQNGDGVKETPRRAARAMDRFIDGDGDGICDHRTQGFGFRRSVTDPGKKMRIQGQGQKK